MMLDQRNGKKQKRKQKAESNSNKYNLLMEEGEESSSDDESQDDRETIQWIENYKVPETDRPLDELLNLANVKGGKKKTS